jgi:putative endopeptidase
VNNLQQTFSGRISRLEWMSAATKEKALTKLMAITKKIAYPDKWKQYEGLEITPHSLLNNVRNANKWAYAYNINKLGKPIDRTEFNFSTPTVNASYGSAQNTITFPAGILQFPFFDFGADDAVNYGGIVAVIGHEMTHGFDDQGRQSDADGSLRDWWSKEDADKFKVLADAVTKQYDAAVVLDSLHVNGKLTLGENLADYGGIAMAYEAFKKTPQGKSNKKIDGFTPDQRFFLSWAQVWRGIALPETAANLLLTDPHSPARYRALFPPQQMPEFYEAFDIKPGDKMWLPLEQRVHVW